jgi:two-component system, NtrC family, nitrogen regulation response regulator NtrX
MSADILIVDDEADIRNLIQGILEDEGYHTRQAANAKQVFAQVLEKVPSLIILDVWLQNSEFDGLAILEQIKADHLYLPILMISGHGTIETAVTAIRQGAYDFIEKPFKTDRLLLMIERALENSRLKQENVSLKKQAAQPVEMIGSSPAFQQMHTVLLKVAPTNSRVLISGTSGSGKEMAARFLHQNSQRAHEAFFGLNCASLNPDRLEQELFGYDQKGVVHHGILERAHKGTLLLDEVSDMPLETQGKIVRVLQDQQFMRVGGSETVKVDVRVIASTSRNLQDEMEAGRFREDLFYRLNVVPIRIPSLRERKDDIAILVDHFMNLYARQSGSSKREWSESALLALQAYDWPGNIRQLKNLVEWLMIMGGNNTNSSTTPATDPTSPQDPILVEHLPSEISHMVPDSLKANWSADMVSLPLREAREVFEREYLLAQVMRFNGNISRTSQFVGMERSALHRKLKSLNIQTSDKDEDPTSRDDTSVEKFDKFRIRASG